MIAVIFEVWPADGETERYMQIAAALRAELETIEGFISVERFRSLSDPDKLLSLSFFENEEAVLEWRNRPAHRRSQSLGRAGVFRDYRLRIAEVTRDYGLDRRLQAPADSRAVHGRTAEPAGRPKDR